MRVMLKQEYRGCDVFGCGHFGASRGTRKHIGLDLKATKGDCVYSPIKGKVTKLGYAYSDDLSFRYVEIKGDSYLVRVFYIHPSVRLGEDVTEKTLIGVAQTLGERYKGITDHVHVEVRRGVKLLDPEQFFKEDK